jgi:hypothetical protein
MTGDDRGGRAPGKGDNAGTRNTEQGAMSGAEEIPAEAEVAAPVPGDGPPTAATGEDATAVPSPPPPPEQGDPKTFVLGRELSEVHLLLDNISANPTTTVTELAKNRPPLLAEDDWVEQICRISWPPHGTNADQAHQAAILIAAKDYLNRLSYPASGSTIAFTLLVTQEDGGTSADPAPPPPPSGPATPSRSSLARTAYPDLLRKAAGFRRWMVGMSAFLIFALLLTCAISWYVAYGNAALSEMSAARAKLTEAQKAVDDAEIAEASAKATEVQRQGAGAAGSQAPAVPENAGRTTTSQTTSVAPPPATPYVAYCARGKPPVYTSATQLQTCRALTQARTAIGRAEMRLAGWVCWGCFKDLAEFDMPTQEELSPNLYSPDSAKWVEAAAIAKAKEKERLAKRKKAQHDDELLLADAPARATAYANILATAVLPFLYGLLGAGAAIVRSLSRKIRASLLSPRDLHLSLQQLALGAVIGACIGLFVAAPSDAGEGLLGPVTLSASALSFVAGFGVEAVFQGIESLITRIFNLTQAPSGNRGDGLPSN